MSKRTLYGRAAHKAQRLILSTASIAVISAVLSLPAHAQTAESVTLDEAITRSVEFDPGLRAAHAGVEAALGARRQAGARPNPEFGIEVDNFAGSGALRGFDGVESTFSLSQELEIGGQRRARINVAERELKGANLDRVIRGLDLIRDVQLAYYGALAADELVVIARQRLATAEAMNTAVARRVRAARDPVMAGARAQAALAEARSAMSRAKSEAATAHAGLTSYWGATDGIRLITADFALPKTETHAHEAPNDASLDISRLMTERERALAAVSLERSLGWQNPSVSLGYRRFEETGGDGALVAGVSAPLGIFDRNRGSIARATAEARRAELDLEAGRLALAREYAALERAQLADAQEVTAFEKTVIPQAKRALELAQEGYERGALSYLDVIEAQRALSDARESRVQSLLSFHQNDAAIDRLTARFSQALTGTEAQP